MIFAPAAGDHDVAIVGGKTFGFTAGRGIMRDRLTAWFPGAELSVRAWFMLIDSVEAATGRFFVAKVCVRV